MRHSTPALILAAAVLSPCGQAQAAACVSNTLAAYTAANFNCTIGDLTFSSFIYTPSPLSNVVIPAAQITVNPINGAMRGIEIFDPADFTVAGAFKLYSATFSFIITVANNGNAINGIQLTELGGQVLGPTGSESVTKNYCATGGTLANCPAPPGGVLPGFQSLTVYPAAPTSSATFAAVTTIGVSDVLTLSTGADAISSAHVSAFQNLVTQVPEPLSWLMFTSGFAALLFFSRRRTGC